MTTRIVAIVEGETEERFVSDVLNPRFCPDSIFFHPILIGKPHSRGGIGRSYGRAKRDVVLALKQDRGCFCTTMFDFYALPKDFPGFPLADNLSSQEKATVIENAMSEDIAETMGTSFDRSRFIPYIQMHEFEALLFSDPRRLAKGIFRDDLEPALAQIRDAYESPEDIDDGVTTAPSKRIINLYPGYKYSKPLYGSLAAMEIGLDTLRSQCDHFDGWLRRILACKVGN